MTYMLDTNICIYLIKRQPESVVKRLFTEEIEQVGISIITVAELEFGVTKSQFPERNSVALIEFLTPFRILEFDQAAAHEYGRIRAFLEEKGQVIGPMDLLIAAHATSRNLVLVTNNEREFQRVPKLTIENWVAE
jgi:tRNA(fMet)-specific endonuclease VapC